MTDVQSLHRTLLQSCKNNDWNTAAKAIPPLKIALMERNALVPSDSVNPALLFAARDILEMAAITSIHKDDSVGFTRYYDQLQPFYLNPTLATKQSVMRTRVSGLYLLLLLSKNDIAGFHTTLEHLADVFGRETLEKDPNLKYPMELEQWLMEGAYNRVWNAANGDKVPSADYLVYTKVLAGTIQDEIASSAEKAYPSLPISNTKNLLFMKSEGEVIQFAKQRGWEVKDGRIYFPSEGPEREVVESEVIIKHTIGYAQELETIV